MSSFTNFVFGFILIVIWVVAGSYVTVASVNLTSFRNTDDDLHRAYWFTFWAAFVTWALIAIFIILVILSIIGVVALFGSGVGEAGVAAEGVEGESFLSQAGRYGTSSNGQSLITSGISWLTIAFLIFALILVSITGVLSAIAASSMAASPNFDRSDQNLNTAYIDCIIAASISIGAAGILFIGTIVYFIIGYRNEQKRQEELANIRTIQQRNFREQAQEQASLRQTTRIEQLAALQRLYQQAGQPAAYPQITPLTQTPAYPRITETAPNYPQLTESSQVGQAANAYSQLAQSYPQLAQSYPQLTRAAQTYSQVNSLLT